MFVHPLYAGGLEVWKGTHAAAATPQEVNAFACAAGHDFAVAGCAAIAVGDE
jgi:hypothetical protein